MIGRQLFRVEEDADDLDLLRITSDIDKFFNGDIDNTNTYDKEYEEDSLISDGNIWKNDKDDSLDWIEKYEKLKNRRGSIGSLKEPLTRESMSSLNYIPRPNSYTQSIQSSNYLSPFSTAKFPKDFHTSLHSSPQSISTFSSETRNSIESSEYYLNDFSVGQFGYNRNQKLINNVNKNVHSYDTATYSNQSKKPFKKDNSKLSYKQRKLLNKKKGFNIDEESNKIDIESILKRRDRRTTIMIKNIPNKYTLKNLIDDLNLDLAGKFDLLYLPLDYVNNCNLGFAFINFVDSMHIILFNENFTNKRWRKFNSEKICQLAYAKIQGKKDLIAHFEKGTVLNFESEDKRPLILDTPSPPPKVALPLGVMKAFREFHPMVKCEIISEDKFEINSIDA